MSAVQEASPIAGGSAEGLEDRLEQHRTELTAYCYRMLASPFEAEDAVQETVLRAWRGLHRFEGRASLRSWLYRIATNVCLDMLAGRERRARPIDLGPVWSPDGEELNTLPEATWVAPIPDGLVVPDGDPADVAIARDSIRLALIAALQHLPPRQRAVLILCEVLRWKATEVAELLDTSVASVNSALQRARSTLATADFTATERQRHLDETDRALLARYVDAFERYDMDGLTSLIRKTPPSRCRPTTCGCADGTRSSNGGWARGAAVAARGCFRRRRRTGRPRSGSTGRAPRAATTHGRSRCSKCQPAGSSR